ncbi:MAG: hypothetical protein JRI57_04715 [Deltaproteobacteria bacterium]|nr:hypothetical protein [Deltaproteobacteria bacterium]MBW1986123.1 hypothetical protein [Deltaproteobacteria bacterium]MBW2134191.1 hypothetical protein [Deltaproteobacteria bacterium]
MKKLFRFFRRDRENLKAILKIFFLSQNLMVPQIQWNNTRDPGNDTVCLMIYYYARILYELAELNENRVARELLDYVRRVARRLLSLTGPERRFQIPLGELRLGQSLDQPADRLYEAKLISLGSDSYRLDFQGVIGKEKFFLPASVLGLLQYCIDHLGEEYLDHLAQGLQRLHYFYRYRQDFWEGAGLLRGPAFALGKESLPPPGPPEEPNPVEE